MNERAIELLPIIVQIGAWGRRHRPESEKLDEPAKDFLRHLAKGGPAHWEQLMSALRETHLGKRKGRKSKEAS